MKGHIENGLYVLQGSTVIESVSAVEENVDSKCLLWHKRLRHVTERGLNELSKQGLLNGEKIGKLPFYENYIFGQATRLKFIKSVHSTIGILNYIHSDLWGSLKTPYTSWR